MKSFFCLSLLLSISAPSFAVDFLTSAEKTFFSPEDKTRIGIEVEFQGLTMEQALNVIRGQIGGEVGTELETQKTTIVGKDSAGAPIYGEKTQTNHVIRNSKLGTVRLKPERNQLTDAAVLKNSRFTLELVTEPITVQQAEPIQAVADALRKAGARGTSAGTAVATQVNVELGQGIRDNLDPGDLVNVLRSYFHPYHRPQIDQSLEVPKIRKPFVAGLTPTMLERLLDPAYSPSWRELYDDYVYRQSLELLGVRDAWKMPIEEARRKLLSRPNPIVPRVVKQNALRITSLLGHMIPEDPMTKWMVDSGWIKTGPYIEFREWNNDFNVMSPVKQALGIKRAAERYGYYAHDDLLQELSGVDKNSIHELRLRSTKAAKKGEPVVYRYFLADPKAVDIEEYLSYKDEAYAKKDIVGFLSPSERGAKPVVIPGESVVMHRRPIHATNIRGKYNPGLINSQIAQALENKWTEAKFWEEYAPGAMPETEQLTTITRGETKPARIIEALNRKYPQGWVLKGIWDLGTEDGIITDKTDILGEIEKYRRSDFDRYKARIDADPALKEAGQEYYLKKLGQHKGFKGWKISQMLKRQPNIIAQAKMAIDKEFRVEVIGGYVLGNGSTIDRYSYKTDYKKPAVSPAEIAEAEEYTRQLLMKLPPELKTTPFAFDVVKKKDGTFGIVESNFGSNSNFLYEEDWHPSIKALTDYLEKYPGLEKKGLVHPGMAEDEQLAWLAEKFKKWDIDTARMYPGFLFGKNKVLDVEFPEKKVNPANFRFCQKQYADLYRRAGGLR